MKKVKTDIKTATKKVAAQKSPVRKTKNVNKATSKSGEKNTNSPIKKPAKKGMEMEFSRDEIIKFLKTKRPKVKTIKVMGEKPAPRARRARRRETKRGGYVSRVSRGDILAAGGRCAGSLCTAPNGSQWQCSGSGACTYLGMAN